MDMSGFVDISPIVVWIIVLLLSMLPIIEARFGIPLGVASDIWGTGTLEVWQSMLAGMLGGIIIGVVLIICYQPIKKVLSKSKLFSKLYNTFVIKLVSKFNKRKKEKIVLTSVEERNRQKKKYWMKFWSLLIFLILPVPGSGVWSCAILGCLLKLRVRDNILVIVIGNIVSCLFIAILSALFIQYITIILVVGVIIAIMYVIYKLIERIIVRRQKKERLV